jgi:hypothetical protein
MERKAQKGPDVRKIGGEKRRNYSENRLRIIYKLAHGIAAPFRNYEKWDCRW